MGRVSRKPLNKDLKEDLEEQLSFIISSLNKKEDISSFLDEFLTPEEKLMLGKRLILYMMLYKGMASKEIKNSLGMSFETVRWYKLIYEGKSEKFRQSINKLINRENAKQMWGKVEKILKPFDLALRSKTDMKARAKFISADYD